VSYPQNLRDLIVLQTAKAAKLHDFSDYRFFLGRLDQRLVQGEDIIGKPFDGKIGFFGLDSPVVSAMSVGYFLLETITV
jgi:hypothetical protein